MSCVVVYAGCEDELRLRATCSYSIQPSIHQLENPMQLGGRKIECNEPPSKVYLQNRSTYDVPCVMDKSNQRLIASHLQQSHLS